MKKLTLQEAKQQILQRKLSIENDDNIYALRICLKYFWPKLEIIVSGSDRFYFQDKSYENNWFCDNENPCPAYINCTELAALIEKGEVKEPKEGEWWYWWYSDTNKCVLRIGKSGIETIDSRVVYSEAYNESGHVMKNKWVDATYLQRPAKKEEIEHFMGLHAEQLGMKEGVKIRSANDFEYTWLLLDKLNLKFEYRELRLYSKMQCCESGFIYNENGYIIIRDENGQWATVVKEEEQWQPKVGEEYEFSNDFKNGIVIRAEYFGKGTTDWPYLCKYADNSVGSKKFCRPIQKEKIALSELCKLAGKEKGKLDIDFNA